MDSTHAFEAELERVDLLAECVSAFRSGSETPPEHRAALDRANRRVSSGRQHRPWSALVEHHGLLSLDLDILSCCLAPEAAPRLGWTFQALQPGISSPFPTPALLRELLFLNGEETRTFYDRLAPSAPLFREGLLEPATSAQTFSPLRPTSAARSIVFSHAPAALQLPGAVEVKIQATWDQLVLPSAAMRSLRELMLWVTHRTQLEQGWGARVGGGPLALFAGPSGTGKSFAAEVVTGALGYRLFRVDLGLLVSKYVGETEKNLNALFDAAAGRPLVLLFDEADSLFGRRGEIRDARDRYANLEVSHLLARIERHQGPCILTTNLRQQIDPAFARRFQVVVEFPLPDSTQRAELWRSHVPARAPIAKTVDLEAVAASVPLTGGQIRNIALHAAFLAAGEAMPITPVHLARALWNELGKEGREVPRRSLGALEPFLPPELGR